MSVINCEIHGHQLILLISAKLFQDFTEKKSVDLQNISTIQVNFIIEKKFVVDSELLQACGLKPWAEIEYDETNSMFKLLSNNLRPVCPICFKTYLEDFGDHKNLLARIWEY
jgi:hypothetical protein